MKPFKVSEPFIVLLDLIRKRKSVIIVDNPEKSVEAKNTQPAAEATNTRQTAEELIQSSVDPAFEESIRKFDQKWEPHKPVQLTLTAAAVAKADFEKKELNTPAEENKPDGKS